MSPTNTTTTPPLSDTPAPDTGSRNTDTAGRGGGGGRGGRGGGRGNVGGRGRGGNGNRNDSNLNATNGNDNVSSTNKYKGKTSDLNGNCFHTHSENPKRTEFITTLEAIKMYAAKEYKSQFAYMKDNLFEKLMTQALKNMCKYYDHS